MNVTEEVLLRATWLANQISWYLYRTNRVLKAIELSKEQLFLLHQKSLKHVEKELVVSAKLEAYAQIFLECSSTNQTRLAIDSARKFLDLLPRQNNSREAEGVVSLGLALCYMEDCDLNEAKEFGIKALSIATESRRKEDESVCYATLLRIFIRLGEHVTAKEYGEKAIAIAQEISDKKREAECHEALGIFFLNPWVPGEAKHYFKRALVLRRETGCENGGKNAPIYFRNLLFGTQLPRG